jgi:pimeloyl-ACP methyl ester carboxylesterase
MSEQVGRVESKRVGLTVPESNGEETEVGVRYLEAGGRTTTNEPPVVLLHGIGLDSAAVSWKRVLPSLGTDRRVIALDFPGHGDSEKPTRSYTTPYYSGVLDAFLDSLELDQVALCGISMGGGIALERALREPESVSRLVLVDSHGLGRDAPWRAPGFGALWTPFFDSVLEQGLRDPATVEVSLRTLTVDPDPEFVGDVQEAIADPAVVRALVSWQRSEFKPWGLETCFRDRLGEIDVPTLLCHGCDDPIFPVTWSERAGELIPESTVRTFERCGHWPPREHPARFMRLLEAFLAGNPVPE